MSEKKNVPKLRFPEFTEPWEQRKLGEISDKVTKKNQDVVVDEVFTNSAEYGIISQRDFFDKDIANTENIDGYYVVEPNDFVYNPRISTTAPFGPIKRNKLERSGAMSPLYYVFRPNNVDLSYLEWFFQTSCWYPFMRFNGNSGARSDRFAITDKIFNEMPISLPQDIEEQKRIGMFLTTLDTLITLHQRKLDHVKDLKKSMLQKMFPKNGQLYPEVRFPEFTDAWEQRKLGDMGSTFNGLSGKTKDDFGHGEAKFITYMNVFSNPIADLTMTESIEIDKKQKSVKAGDVFFTTSSETPDEVGMSSVMPEDADNIYLNSFCFGYRPTEKFDLNYLAYVLRADSFRKEMTFLAQGISRYNISKNKVMEVCIPVPTIEEQTKVGRYFRNLDHLITLHQRKLGAINLTNAIVLFDNGYNPALACELIILKGVLTYAKHHYQKQHVILRLL